MPKSIIREFDNSKASSTLSSNFAVVVPGIMGTPKGIDGVKIRTADKLKEAAKKEGIYFESDNIYKLNSQAQFETYIGKANGASLEPTGPVLNEVLDKVAVAGEENLNLAYRYCSSISHDEIYSWSKDLGYHYYTGTQVASGTDGLLQKVLTDATTNETQTWKFTLVDIEDLKEALEIKEEGQATVYRDQTALEYFKIYDSQVGNNAVAEIDHLGNRIAYELLGLGYTVWYKVMTNVAQLATSDFWSPLKNKSTYQFRYLMAGGCYDPAVAEKMVAIADFNNKVTIEDAETFGNENGRGDCIALLDIDESSLNSDSTRAEKLEYFGDKANALPASKYAAIFAPRMVYNLPQYISSDSDNENIDGDVKFPGSFHYLACAAQAQERFAEWYAVAGYTRGVCPLTVYYPTCDFGDIDINTLAPRALKDTGNYTTRAINLVLSERGNYYLWGNRTAELLDKDGLRFSHFLNIRQLCCTIKQVLYEATRRFTFDPNSDLLWVNFVNAIRPTLERMKSDQGIRGYRISRVETDKKALLVAKIRIVPIEALEDFDISIYLEDSLSGINISADEEVADAE